MSGATGHRVPDFFILSITLCTAGSYVYIALKKSFGTLGVYIYPLLVVLITVLGFYFMDWWGIKKLKLWP